MMRFDSTEIGRTMRRMRVWYDPATVDREYRAE
jgi:hypothetical protein